MAKETKEEVKVNTNLIRRYPPNVRFDFAGFKDCPTIIQNKNPYNKHESITDKESYRLNLASMRGAISSLTPERQKGAYAFEDGVYDRSKDISYILRKDLSIVEIDEYIQRQTDYLKACDSDLKEQVETDLQKLKNKRAEIALAEKASSESSSASKSE